MRRFLSSSNPIGMHVRVTPMTFGAMAPVTREIIGVVGQVRERPGEPSQAPQLYVPIAQNSWFAASIVAAFRARHTGSVTADDPFGGGENRTGVAFDTYRARSEEIASEATARPRFRAQLVGSFAVLALILATVGLFGLLAFSVQQRIQEFGIRIAVGAETADIVWLVITKTAWITVSGIALGLGMSAGLSRFLQGLLFGVEPIDLTTFAAVAALLLMTALGAALAPLRRATRVDPLVALRYE